MFIAETLGNTNLTKRKEEKTPVIPIPRETTIFVHILLNFRLHLRTSHIDFLLKDQIIPNV